MTNDFSITATTISVHQVYRELGRMDETYPNLVAQHISYCGNREKWGFCSPEDGEPYEYDDFQTAAYMLCYFAEDLCGKEPHPDLKSFCDPLIAEWRAEWERKWRDRGQA